ncbi:MAG: CrcB family protein, partial [Sphingomonas sp.]
MIETFAVATGGAFGSGARYWVALWLVPWSRTLPLGTIGINIVGSVAISFFGTLTLARGSSPSPRPGSMAMRC